MDDPPPRLLLVDDNIRVIGGHFLELATLLMDGGRELGYCSRLATHQSFDASQLGPIHPDRDVQPIFGVRQMVNWSLGVDGRSSVRRDRSGRNIGGTKLQNLRQRLLDPLHHKCKHPQFMLKQWADDFCETFEQWSVTPQDRLVLNTGDDFVLLALANALDRIADRHPGLGPLTIHVIFHFAIADPQTSLEQKRQFVAQFRNTIERMDRHHIHLHATTDSLTEQFSEVGIAVNSIPYPTRNRQAIPKRKRQDNGYKLVLAGTPRSEKGTRMIAKLFSMIDAPFLSSGRFSLSMQKQTKPWKRFVPAPLGAMIERWNRNARRQQEAFDRGSLEIKPGNMQTSDYHDWLGTADVGLFLYAPHRYVARCSGVLLEMFICGVPVIVPDCCWLADQVRQANRDGVVGYIYRTLEEIPGILEQLEQDYDQVRGHSLQHAQVISRRHQPANTLSQMGIAPIAEPSLRIFPYRIAS